MDGLETSRLAALASSSDRNRNSHAEKLTEAKKVYKIIVGNRKGGETLTAIQGSVRTGGLVVKHRVRAQQRSGLSSTRDRVPYFIDYLLCFDKIVCRPGTSTPVE